MKIYIAFITFLFATQSVFDLLYSLGILQVQVYSSNTYSWSFLIDIIIVLNGFYLILQKNIKETK